MITGCCTHVGVKDGRSFSCNAQECKILQWCEKPKWRSDCFKCLAVSLRDINQFIELKSAPSSAPHGISEIYGAIVHQEQLCSRPEGGLTYSSGQVRWEKSSVMKTESCLLWVHTKELLNLEILTCRPWDLIKITQSPIGLPQTAHQLISRVDLASTLLTKYFTINLPGLKIFPHGFI